MRTAFSMQISWVYELKLVDCQQGLAVGGEEGDSYPWPSLMAFVYGARNDMPLEPLEILSALLLGLASVPTDFRRSTERQIWTAEGTMSLVEEADRWKWTLQDLRWLWRWTYE